MASLSSKPTYVRRKPKRKVRWQFLLILVALVGVGSYFGVKKVKSLLTPKEVIIEYALEGLSVEESKAILSSPNNEEGEYELVDYVLYGESLQFYADTYKMGTKDELVGKNIMCRNASTGSELVYYLGSYLDEGIHIYELPVGVYEVYLSSLMKNERMFMKEEMKEEFYTITRKGITHKVTLLADTNYFYPDHEELNLDKPYVYILVEEAQLPDEYYDIVIDPGHFAYDCYVDSCYGYIDNGSTSQKGKYVESELVYQVSLVLKEELEKAGFKVLMTRDDITPVDMYGVDGRIYKSVKAKAKLFISNHLNSINDSSVHGAEVWHSAYSTTTFAQTVLNSLVENTNIVASGNIGGGNKIPSVISSTVSAEKYGQKYDGFMMIREPGGKGTQAGRLSEAAIKNNGPFVEDINYGAQALLIEYVYMSNKKDIEAWEANYESYGKAVAAAIIDYLQIDFYDTEMPTQSE